jgi:uncharacterized protein YbjT (DUF2867 family)
MTPTRTRPVLLLVGGGGGLVGRAVMSEFGRDWAFRSVHRHPAPSEEGLPVEWIRLDLLNVRDWAPLVRGVDLVLTLAWYRQGYDRRFAPLARSLGRLIDAAAHEGVPRFLHVSVPDAPPRMETDLPYLAHKREVDRALVASGLDYSIVRPTMLFGPKDRLLSVMMRLMRRYHRFPMFGDGAYHVSPIAVRDLAHILRREASLPGRRNVLAGGPTRYVYRDLTDRMFAALGLPPRYFRLSPRASVRVASLFEGVGSSLIYAYEVEWLLADLLGLPPYEGLDRPLAPVEPFLAAEAARLLGRDPGHER